MGIFNRQFRHKIRGTRHWVTDMIIGGDGVRLELSNFRHDKRYVAPWQFLDEYEPWPRSSTAEQPNFKSAVVGASPSGVSTSLGR